MEIPQTQKEVPQTQIDKIDNLTIDNPETKRILKTLRTDSIIKDVLDNPWFVYRLNALNIKPDYNETDIKKLIQNEAEQTLVREDIKTYHNTIKNLSNL
jgi:hypothetical protein